MKVGLPAAGLEYSVLANLEFVFGPNHPRSRFEYVTDKIKIKQFAIFDYPLGGSFLFLAWRSIITFIPRNHDPWLRRILARRMANMANVCYFYISFPNNLNDKQACC